MLRAAAGALVAAFLALLLVIVPSNLNPEQSASALCLSSIDPKCSPGVIPILTELGITRAGAGAVSGPGAAQTAATSAANGYAQNLFQVAFNTSAAALAGLGLMWSNAFGLDAKSAGVLSARGLVGAKLDTDPDYIPATTGPANSTLNADCYAYPWSGLLTAASRPVSIAAASSCDPQPASVTFRYSSGIREFMYTTSGNTLTLTPLDSPRSGAYWGVQVWLACSSLNQTAGYEMVRIGQFDNPQPHNLTTAQNYVDTHCTSGTRTGRLGWFLSGDVMPGSTAAGYVMIGWNGYDSPNVYEQGGNVAGFLDLELHCMGTSGAYTVSQNVPYSVAPGEQIVVPDVVCASGDVATGIGGTVTAPGQPPAELIDPEENQAIPEIAELPGQYPLCFGPEAQTCVLELEQLDGSTWVTCGPGAQWCPTWAATPSPQLEATYRCQFGPYAMEINYCSSFRAPLIGLLPNTGADGELLPPSAPVPNLSGFLQLYNLDGSPYQGGTPVDGPGPQNCWPEGWGVINPASWVLEPLRCALEWAFVPRQSVVVQQAAAVTAAWGDTAPMRIAAVVASIVDELPELEGCEGPPVVLDFELGPIDLDYTGYPLSACEEPMSSWAALARTIAGLSMIWSALVASSRYASAVVAFPQFGAK